MQINTKFDIGQRVYKIAYKRASIEGEKCTACKGVGKITLSDKVKYVCPKCFGAKRNRIQREYRIPEEIIIDSIIIKDTGISYLIPYSELLEDEIFGNYAECEEACNKPNMKETHE